MPLSDISRSSVKSFFHRLYEVFALLSLTSKLSSNAPLSSHGLPLCSRAGLLKKEKLLVSDSLVCSLRCAQGPERKSKDLSLFSMTE